MPAANPTRTRAKAPARKTAARKSAAKRQNIEPLAADFEPIELSTEADSNEEQLVHLFSVDGKAYYVSAAQDIGLALRYVKVATTKGENLAILWLLENVLTPEAFEALTAIPRLKPESLAKVAAAVQKLLIGGMEAPKA
ncbi:MAG TPA: hypothetical protein VFA96_10815 [Nocardioides sp.]|nr:hypothetical protein [Nocardioides sp.]